MLAGLASSGVRSSTSVCVKWMSFTPALQRWFPGHGQPWYCLFKATDMPGILETKENQNLTKCASSHGGFPKVCMDPNAGSGTLGSVTAETRKLEAERILGDEAKKRTVFLGLCSNVCSVGRGAELSCLSWQNELGHVQRQWFDASSQYSGELQTKLSSSSSMKLFWGTTCSSV